MDVKTFGAAQGNGRQYLTRYIGNAPNPETYQNKWHERFLDDERRYQANNVSNGKVPSDSNGSPNIAWYEDQAKEEFKRADEMYRVRYQAFLVSASRALVDTRFMVRVPFFGITFDINDLGSLSGIGLMTLLALFRFSISSELENLKLSFRHVRQQGKLAEFYRLLSMKQVLTTPHLPEREIGWFHTYVPKLLYFLPLLVYLSVVLHDIDTNNLGNQIDNVRTFLVLATDIIFLLIIIALSISAFQRTRDVDRQWMNAWCDYMAEEFHDTLDGEWLRRLHHAFEQRRFFPEQLVASLPEADEKPGKSHVYRSKDSWLLIIDLDAGTASLKPAEQTKIQGASA